MTFKYPNIPLCCHNYNINLLTRELPCNTLSVKFLFLGQNKNRGLHILFNQPHNYIPGLCSRPPVPSVAYIIILACVCYYLTHWVNIPEVTVVKCKWCFLNNKVSALTVNLTCHFYLHLCTAGIKDGGVGAIHFNDTLTPILSLLSCNKQ